MLSNEGWAETNDKALTIDGFDGTTVEKLGSILRNSVSDKFSSLSFGQISAQKQQALLLLSVMDNIRLLYIPKSHIYRYGHNCKPKFDQIRFYP
jgi:hypothetical protein